MNTGQTTCLYDIIHNCRRQIITIITDADMCTALFGCVKSQMKT